MAAKILSQMQIALDASLGSKDFGPYYLPTRVITSHQNEANCAVKMEVAGQNVKISELPRELS